MKSSKRCFRLCHILISLVVTSLYTGCISDKDWTMEKNSDPIIALKSIESDVAFCSDGIDNDGDASIDCDDTDCFGIGECIFELQCSDGVDNDANGLIDCFDDACMFTPTCFSDIENTIEKCSDGVDNDKNGVQDCEDPTCLEFVLCQEPLEHTKAQCEDGIDNDGDGRVDCDDDEFCFEFANCQPQTETTAAQCEDRKDNDGDGSIDCDDEKCLEFDYCSGPKENTYPLCIDGLDNNFNGSSDCADEECKFFLICNLEENTEETCQDGVDNDGTGTIDCDDSKCNIFAFCSEGTIAVCQDGLDNDEDGFTDCADDECAAFDFCNENSVETCTDGKDNDSDGTFDCDDVDCKVFPICSESTELICSDGIDNDEDGAIDCADSECQIFPMCQEDTELLCGDLIDNDGDGAADCEDIECHKFDHCEVQRHEAEGVGGGGSGSGEGEGNGGGGSGGTEQGTCGDATFIYNAIEKFDVTIYDHETGPEFNTHKKHEMPAIYVGKIGEDAQGVTKGMVQEELGSNGRPVFKAIPGNVKAATGCDGCGWWNENIADWWLESDSVVKYETTFDFKHQGGGVYKFEQTQFFPLFEVFIQPDGQTKVHNPISGGPATKYSFAMHLQRKFQYDGVANQRFEFSGDDDVFVYLNGHLVIDLGGIHSPADDFFILSEEADKLGIKQGEEVVLDFFMAERMEEGSQVIITTSIPCLAQ